MANATIAASIAAGIAQIVTDCGDSVTFNANAYTAGRSVLETEKQYDPLGEMEGYTETYTLLQSALDANGDAPEAGDQITTPDGIRRILRVRRDGSFDTMTRVDVGDLY
tara:strand:+ start:12519 stop:12845 length:327 start_codon:yes stop_codon:yes gene_type:complete